MIKGPENLKLLKELLDKNPEESVAKLKTINNNTHQRMREVLGLQIAIGCAIFLYGICAYVGFTKIELREEKGSHGISLFIARTIVTLYLSSLVSIISLFIRLFESGLAPILRAYKNLKFVRNNSYKNVLCDQIENPTDETLKNITAVEFYNLMESFRSFELYVAQTPNEDLQVEDFIDILVMEKEFDKLLTLVKLYPDKIEEFDAHCAITSGRNSLAWLAAKETNKHKIAVPEDCPEDVKVIIEASKRYAR